MSSDFCYGARPVSQVITDYLGLPGLDLAVVEKISLYGHDGILVRGTEGDFYCARDITYVLATDSQNNVMFRRVTSAWRPSSYMASVFFDMGYGISCLIGACQMVPEDEDPMVDRGLISDVLAAYGIISPDIGFEQYVAELSNDIFIGTVCQDFIPMEEYLPADPASMMPPAYYDESVPDGDLPFEEDDSQKVYLI
jgi:hypothetical protein